MLDPDSTPAQHQPARSMPAMDHLYTRTRGANRAAAVETAMLSPDKSAVTRRKRD